MATSIEWTDQTWNPVVGCERVSPGCDRCYAIGVAHRQMQPAHVGLTVHRPGERTDWTGEVRCLPDRLAQPLHWRRPRRVFVNSMSDLFHPDVPDWFIFAVWRTISRTPWHTYQVLTKRPQRMPGFFARLDDRAAGLPPTMFATEKERATILQSGRAVMFDALVDSWGDPPEGFARPKFDWQGGERWWPTDPPNLWLGTSIEHRRYAYRANALRATPAAVRFISAEPLLGHLGVDLDLTGIDWLIVGAESGPGARPMEIDWARALRDRCADEGVAFFVKQLTGTRGRPIKDLADFPPDLQIREFPR